LFTNQIGCSYISYDQDGNPIPRESDPQLVFDRLFRDPLRDPVQRAAMNSLLDRVRDDARSLTRKAGREDKQTLDAYFTALRETERRLQQLGDQSGAPPKVDFTTLDRPGPSADLNEQVESMLDLIALALWTDSTRCATYMLGNSNSRIIFDFLGIKKQHHYLSHFFRNFSRSNVDDLLRISLWHMEKFNYLLTRMKSFKDHHGTLLEHSVVLFGSGMGHSDNHTATRLPMVIAGQGGGLIKTGRYLRYAGNERLGRLHLALLQAFGVDADSYGGSDKPLPGLDGGAFDAYRERPFETWVKHEADAITASGRLRMSEDLDEAKIFYIDIAGKQPLRIDVGFSDFHGFNLAYHVGTPIVLEGKGAESNGRLVMKKVTGLRSVYGKSQPNKRD